MRRFIFKIALFGMLITGIIIAILMKYGGYADYFYVKFTTPSQHSMVIGDSRSFQGLQPKILDANLNGVFETPIYNYSFTLAQSTYGDAYLNSIKAKLDKTTKNGLFILSVHPWLLAEREDDDVENKKFFEVNTPPHSMHFPSLNPNPEYFFRNFGYFHFKAIFRKVSAVHDDGWMEVKEFKVDSPTLAINENSEFERYKKFSRIWKKSEWRLSKLLETIQYLKNFGTVVLVRMPVNNKIVTLEESFWQGFDADIIRIAAQTNSRYINFSMQDFRYESSDGVHLSNKSGAAFSKILCDSINASVDTSVMIK